MVFNGFPLIKNADHQLCLNSRTSANITNVSTTKPINVNFIVTVLLHGMIGSITSVSELDAQFNASANKYLIT
jgi:hypothetical protein